MNNNEELMEEINDIVDENINIESQKKDNQEIRENTIVPNVEISYNTISVDNEELIVPPAGEYEPSKSKTPLLIILSFLLVLDIAALVIYIIGIDKVLSFIK